MCDCTAASCCLDCSNCAAGTNCGGPLAATMVDWSAGWTITFRSGFSARTGDVLKGETIDVALVGDEVQIGTDARLGRMHKAEVANHIHNPEVFVACGGLHDLSVGGTSMRVVYFNLARIGTMS